MKLLFKKLDSLLFMAIMIIAIFVISFKSHQINITMQFLSGFSGILSGLLWMSSSYSPNNKKAVQFFLQHPSDSANWSDLALEEQQSMLQVYRERLNGYAASAAACAAFFQASAIFANM